MSDIALSGDDLSDDEISDKKLLKRLKQEIKFYETKASPWERKVKRIVRRYKDERNNRENDNARYNVLWSNVQLLHPALYAKKPIANIERRNRMKDDLGRITSSVLERCISFFIDEKMDAAMRQAVLDLLLPGRGVIWVRYEPKFEDEQLTEDVQSETYEKLADEKICWDYVHMEDFGHSWGRTWEEVDIIWRMVPMDRKEQKVRFPDIDVKEIPLDYAPKDSKEVKIDETVDKSKIYECWDKSRNKVFWLSIGYEKSFLDQKDDPLGLQDFFPTPKPLFATLANDSCIPTPDYMMYQDQAIELDQLTGRIAAIVKSVKVAGVYDASAQGVQRLLSEGVENQLLPIDQWAMLSEKGGLAGVMMLMPMEEILKTLLGLYDAREKVKQDIYEITGLSDVLRGASDPNETYGAQRLKSQYGTLRLSARQDEVQRFCRDLVDIGTQIISNHFSPETIQRISNVTLLTTQEKQLVMQNQQAQQAMQQYQQMMKQPPQPGMQPPPPPLPPQPLPPNVARLEQDDIEELMNEPSWDDVIQFLHSEPLLSYRVDIETDSTIKMDQEAEQQSRVQFLTAAGGFIREAMAVTDPIMAPLLGKMLQFGLQSFKVGRDLEGEFEMTIKKLEKEAQNPTPKPNPEMMKIQAQTQLQTQKQQFDMQLEQIRAQNDKAKIAADAQAEAHRLQIQAQVDTNQANLDAKNDMLKQQLEKAHQESELALEQWKAKLESETKIIVAEINAKTAIQTASMSKEDGDGGLTADADGKVTKQPSMGDLLTAVTEKLEEALGGVANSHKQLADAMNKPKSVSRDEQGNYKVTVQ